MSESMLNVNPPNRGIELRFRAMEARLTSFFMKWPVYHEIHR